MKKVLFVMTHLGSDWHSLMDALNKHSNIECFTTGISYKHPEDFYLLTKHPHKKNNSASVWADVILHNKDFASKNLSKYCDFLFWSQGFDPQHPELIQLGERAKDYYDVRLEGMRQYYKRSPNSLWNPSLETDASFLSIFG